MKRVVPGILCVILALSACSVSPSGKATMAPGSYTAVCKGFYGDFPVTVTVSESAMLSIAPGAYKETEALGGKAIRLMIERMLAANTAGVDTVSGATVTSAVFRHAVSGCLAQAGAPESMRVPGKAARRQKKVNASDVIVVGAGAAGFSAAIEAAEGGASVILIEKQDLVGGSTVVSAGIVYAALNPEDEAKMVDYYMARAEGKADRARLQFFAEHSLDTIKFLEKIGVQWLMQVPAGTAPEPRARFSKHPDGTAMIGSALTDPLERKALALGVSILTGVRATALIQDKAGAVVGVKAESNGASHEFKAKAIVLATGGFDASEEMKARYSPIAVGDYPLSNKGNTGDGLAMGIEAGAAVEFSGGVIGFEFVDGSLPSSGYSGAAMGSSVFVKGDGSFVSARADYPINHTNLKKAGGKSFFGLYAGPKAQAGIQAVLDRGFARKADSIAELAAATGMNAANLEDSFKRFGASEGPYYAVVVKTTTIGTMGGLKTDTSAQVLRAADGQPLPGLYAAGEVANGGFYYQEYPASGSSISMSITYGREAGKNAAAYAKGIR